MSRRTEKVASLLKEEIGAILQRDYNRPSLGLTTVVDVRVTPDLRIAKVYFSVYGADAVRTKTMEVLEKEKAEIRSRLARRIRIRFMPALEFFRDDTLDKVDRINEILKKIHEEHDDPSGDAGA